MAGGPLIELLWWDGCPSLPAARAVLHEVLRELGDDPQRVVEREVATDGAAEKDGFVGSPTFRVDGRDLFPTEEPAGLTCRVYRLRDGRYSPTPDPDDLRDALKEHLR